MISGSSIGSATPRGGGTRNIEQHKARIEREVKLGLRRPPKDPGSRPWRKKKHSDPADPAPERPNPKPEAPNRENREPRTRRTQNLRNPRNPRNPENPPKPRCLYKLI